MPEMSDIELNQIERDIEDLHLEHYPITGTQLKAIIKRLRRAERAGEIMAPYMRYYTDRNRLLRANSAWALPRAGVLLGSMAVGVIIMGWSGLVQRFDADPSLINGGFMALSMILPVVSIFLPLNAWINRTLNKRMLEGHYDEKPQPKVLRHEEQVASYVEYYGKGK